MFLRFVRRSGYFGLCASLMYCGLMSVASRADDPAPASAAADAPPAPAVPPSIDFDRDIRPIFLAHCYECHGPLKQESGFRLDQKQAVLKGGEGGYGAALVPGKSAESVLWQAVRGTHDALERMPPERDPLPDDMIQRIAAWIDAGALWPDDTPVGTPKPDPRNHWAFRAPVRAELPAVARTDWARNDLDCYVLARLEQEGLSPSPEADRVTLLRRLSLDLVGLPPTPEEVDAFVTDSRPDAYEQQVERLLNSPHYGERWGRHWLDAARYADSDGYEKDKSRNVWFYRDWVVQAFSRDLPYDQFLIEQLAGDQLPGATQDQRVATGFLRNSMLNEEGGVDPEQFRMDAMFDRMDCLGKCILGLTIQCGQCHAHKYDPLTQEEYYRLFAFLNNDHEPMQVVYTPEELKRCEELLRGMRQIEDELREQWPDWTERLQQWAADTSAMLPAWQILVPDEFGETGGGAKLARLPDNAMLCSGYAPTHCTFRVVGRTSTAAITGLRLELLTNPNLPCGGPGRSFKGTCGLTEMKVEAAPLTDPTKKVTVKIEAVAADFEQTESPLEPAFDDRSGRTRVVGPAAWALDGKDETAWAIDAGPGRRNQPRVAVFRFAEPVSFPEGIVFTVDLVQNHGGWNSDDHQNNLLGCFRLSLTASSLGTVGQALAKPMPLAVADALGLPPGDRSQAQQDALFGYWRRQVPEGRSADERIEALWREWPAGSTALMLASRGDARSTHMLQRGDFLRPAREVTAGVPAFLHPLPDGAPPTRLTLARWLTDRQSPTTARVYVNRVWQAYFGVGLVATSEDFGVQGDRPSHPELLDWLACEFMDAGWSVKRLHRRIVHSATYRQSSRVSPELYARDPQNRLLARGPRARVEGEIVRDIALGASGLLNPTLGGPPVFPPIPESVLALSYGPMTWNAETGPNRYRRALYTFRRRSIPYPMLQNFDTPNGDQACVRRVRSNTPLQALTTLNEVLFVECARALALRALAEGGAEESQRLTYAFRRCVSRQPTAEELAELSGLLARQRARIAEGWTDAREVAGGAAQVAEKLPAGTTPTELAAYVLVSRVLLNLDETITKE